MVWKECAIGLALAGCGIDHVTLRTLPPTMSVDERLAAFGELKPRGELVTQVSSDGGETWEDAGSKLVLANGARITAAEDLLPVVDSESATARAARASAAARRKANIAWWAMVGSGIVGYVLIGGFSFDGPPFGVKPAVAWSVFLGAPLVSYFFLRHYNHVVADERRAAFSHYTRDLGDRLSLCTRDLQLVPCEGPAVPAQQ